MELATALIWTLRIVLPIVLFCIYFKLQSPKEEQYTTASKHQISRGRLLARRQVSLRDGTVPEELKTIALKDQTQAPSLFTATSRQVRGNARKEERGGATRERREKREPKPKPEKAQEPVEPSETEMVAAGEPPEPTEDPSPQEKVHLESLLNYVAFNRKEQQRTFLPDEAGAPPPPPPKPRGVSTPKPTTPGAATPGGETPAAASPAGGDATPGDRPEDEARKANADAQLVLRGAINFKRADVAKDIYDKLIEQNVEISERTFTLMIEASVLAKDLSSASDFLMKMETSGCCPDSDILDKVMDLYSAQKQQKDQEKEYQKEDQTPVVMPLAMAGNDIISPVVADISLQGLDEIFVDGPRAKLSSEARIFVPTFGIPPPPPNPPAPGAAPQEAAQTPVNSDDAASRTKLTAAAKPFEPQFNYSFDSLNYSWTPGDAWEEEAGADAKVKGGSKQGKGPVKEAGDQKAGDKAKKAKKQWTPKA